MAKTKEIIVCCGTGCVANGALKVANALEKELKKQNKKVKVTAHVKRSGCSGASTKASCESTSWRSS